MALYLAGKSIRINCVSPGMVQTELITSASYISEENKRVDMTKYPLGGRYAEPIEVANLILFLLGDESSFITGQNLVIDGGYTLN
jgi:NAD(P)-dependent dehydrogenase (short-subunit alcohol dehydrogenase family)